MRYLKNQVIQGTLILTIAGFITRLIGFVYRVYLSDTIGSRLLGVYQLIFPVSVNASYTSLVTYIYSFSPTASL